MTAAAQEKNDLLPVDNVMLRPTLSALVVAHNEEDRIAGCLECLAFADEIVVVLDKCTDGTKAIVERHADDFPVRFLEGSWDLEGPRRNAGIDFCRGEWIVEVDADERVGRKLGEEIVAALEFSTFDWHEILVDNYIGGRLVRWGWGASFGKAAYPGLFRRDAKRWGNQRVHPSLTWTESNIRRGEIMGCAQGMGQGPRLRERLRHDVDRNISDMIRRLDGYSTARAKDLVDSGKIGSMANNVRRLFSRFIKCYVGRSGYREGGYGFLIALFAGLFPLLSYIKAKEMLEKDK